MIQQAYEVLPRPTQIVVVDSHPIVRYGIKEVLENALPCQVCAEASNFTEAFEQLQALDYSPSVVVTEALLSGRSCFELLQFLAGKNARIPVLAFSKYDEEIYAERMLQAGASGYLMKCSPLSELVTAVQRVLRGGIYLSEKMTNKMLFVATTGRQDMTKSPVERLSNRELEVFQMLGEGLSTRQIASNLHVSVKTIESHRARIKTKLNLEDANALFRYAILWRNQTLQTETPPADVPLHPALC